MNKLDRNEDIIKKKLDKANKEGTISNEDFGILMSEMVIDFDGISYFCVDPLTNGQINAYIAEELNKKINKHPLIWKLLFAVKGL